MGQSSNTAYNSNQKSSQTQTNGFSETTPWQAQQPYLLYGFQESQNAYHQAMKANAMMPTSIAPSAATQAAYQGITQMAMAPQPLVTAAQSNLTNTLNGSHLQAGNPYLQQMINQTSQAVLPSVQGGFASAGRFNSGAQSAAAASAMANAASNLAFQQYNSERNLQNQALGQAPSIANLGYQNFDRLAAVGASQDAANNSALAAARQQAVNPLEYASQYMNMVSKAMGSTTINNNTSNVTGTETSTNKTIKDPSLLDDISQSMDILLKAKDLLSVNGKDTSANSAANAANAAKFLLN